MRELDQWLESLVDAKDCS